MGYGGKGVGGIQEGGKKIKRMKIKKVVITFEQFKTKLRQITSAKMRTLLTPFYANNLQADHKYVLPTLAQTTRFGGEEACRQKQKFYCA